MNERIRNPEGRCCDPAPSFRGRLRPGGAYRWWTGAFAVVASAGCDSSPPASVQASGVPFACTATSPSPWDIGADIPGTILGDEGLDASGGIAAANGTAWVFDPRLGHVHGFETADTVGVRFGRLGGGPGEFSRGGPSYPQPPASWISEFGDTIVVFDGATVHRFDSDGSFVGSIAGVRETFTGLSFTHRIRQTGAGTIMDIEPSSGHAPPAAPRTFRVWHWGRSNPAVLVDVHLPPLPTDSRGARYTGPREARARWDIGAGCLVVSDGSSPWVLLANRTPGLLDTIPVPLPDRTEGPNPDEKELMGQLGAGDRVSPDPVAPLRIRDLVVDPAGVAWLWVLQPDGLPGAQQEVIRVELATGRASVDTLPTFPKAFGAAGVIYGVVEVDGLERVARFGAAAPDR